MNVFFIINLWLLLLDFLYLFSAFVKIFCCYLILIKFFFDIEIFLILFKLYLLHFMILIGLLLIVRIIVKIAWWTDQWRLVWWLHYDWLLNRKLVIRNMKIILLWINHLVIIWVIRNNKWSVHRHCLLNLWLNWKAGNQKYLIINSITYILLLIHYPLKILSKYT